MTTNQMKYFVTLCKTKSFTQTADLLYLTQPAISRQISALEEELGVVLLVRNSGKKFELTAVGKEYFDLFEKFLEEKDHIDFIAQNFEIENVVKYKIAVLMGWCLPELIASCRTAVRAEFPECDLQFEFYDPGAMNEKMKREEVDLAITIEPAYEENPLYYKEYMCMIRSVLFVAAGNPAVRNGQIDISKLEGPLLVHNQMERLRQKQYEYDEILNHKVAIHQFETLGAVFQNVLAGDGVSLCDEWSEPCFSNRYVSQIVEEQKVPVVMAYRKKKEDQFERVVELIKKCVATWNQRK